jgi:hypothetical protein
VALDGFVRSREDLPARRPDLVAELETRLLVPVETDLAAFAAAPLTATRRPRRAWIPS